MTSDTKSPSPEFTGVRIRTIESTDNQAVRTLFAATQADLFGNVEPPELRQGVKDWVERILASDLETPSHYYSQPRKSFWIAEAAGGEIAATVAIDTTADPDVAELFRMLVSRSHRGKGLGRLMAQTAEKWTVQRDYRKLKLTTTDQHIEAMALYRSMGFEHIHTTNMGFLKTLDFEKTVKL